MMSLMQQKRYRSRPGRILYVAGHKVTDDPAGTLLRETASVQEHVRWRRLIAVKTAQGKASQAKTPNAKPRPKHPRNPEE